MALIRKPVITCRICSKPIPPGDEICAECGEDVDHVRDSDINHVTSNFHGKRNIHYHDGRFVSDEPEGD